MFKPVVVLLAFMSSSMASAEMSLVDYLNQPARPLDAKITLNEQHFVSGTIDGSGGALELQTTDGSVFRLTIPAGALERSTEISMSELAAFEHPSFTFDQPAVGVQFSPEGLLFKKAASLKILPKQPVALSSLLAMTSDHDGKDVRLASLEPKARLAPGAVELSLSHFSPYVLTGSQSARETILKAFNRVASARLESWTADQILRSKQSGKPLDPAVLETALTEAFEKVVKAHAGSVETCEGGIEAQRTLLGWMRQGELLGFDHSTLAHANFRSVLVSKTAKLCRDRAQQACYQDHRVFDVLRFALGVERQAQLLGVENDPNAAALIALAVKCARFELVMNSTIATADPGEMKVTAESKIEIWLDHIFDTFKSRGTVQVTAMKLDIEGLQCVLNSLVAPARESSIVGFSLNDVRFDQSLGVFIEGLYPQSVGHFSCTDESDPPNTFPMTLPMGSAGPDDSFWGGMFLALHSQPRHNEYNVKKGRYEIFKWDVLYGETFAVKKYNRTFDLLKEDTTMTIYHRPQR